jgi:hypothetical protein
MRIAGKTLIILTGYFPIHIFLFRKEKTIGPTGIPLKKLRIALAVMGCPEKSRKHGIGVLSGLDFFTGAFDGFRSIIKELMAEKTALILVATPVSRLKPNCRPAREWGFSVREDLLRMANEVIS